jgi:uncharacterized membrane protein (UPF0127 family)
MCQSVKVGGEWFHLELAADDKVRMKGLGQRTNIAPDGGMLFVFPRADEPQRRRLRGCATARLTSTIIYLDGSGRIGNWHAMKGDPRKADEGAVGETGYDEKGNKVTLSEGAQK